MVRWEMLCCPFCCLQERNGCGKGHFYRWHVVGFLVWPIWSLLEVLTVFICLFFGCSYGVGWEWGRGGSAQAAAWSCIAMGSVQPVHKSLSLGAPSLHLSFFYLPFPIAHPECLRTWVKKLFWKKMQFVGKKTSLNLSCDYFWGAFRDELFQILWKVEVRNPP